MVQQVLYSLFVHVVSFVMVKVVVEYHLTVQMVVVVLMADHQNHLVMVEEYHHHLLLVVIVIYAEKREIYFI